MPARRAISWVALFAVLALVGTGVVGPLGSDDHGPPGVGPGAEVAATVTRVVDGDTVKVSIERRPDTVRYIGVDTPETRKPGTAVQCFGHAASARNQRLVDGVAVTLRTDAEPRDRYGRLLAYVYRRRDGLFVNGALVRNGYATTLTIAPNVAHAAQLSRLERAARRAGAGLWGACR